MPFVFPALNRKSEDLLLGASERLTAQLSAKLVANLGHDLDLGRVIEFGVLELMDGMLVINRVGR